MSEPKVLFSARDERRRRGARPPGRGRTRRLHLVRRLIAVLVLAAIMLVGLSLVRRGTPPRPIQRAVVQPAAPPPAPHHKPSTYARVPASVQVDPRLKLGLRAGVLFDVNSGKVLWQRNATRRLPIASLTKMMTALVVAMRSNLDGRVLITRQAIDFSGSGVGLLPLHKRVPEMPLLYGLLLPSGNDAAVALAQHVAGSEARFVGLMNAEARRMGLTCTHFSNASGIVDQDNYSCARDLAVLTHAVVKRPIIRRIVATRSAILPFPVKGGKLYLYNNNPLLMGGFPGTDGVKTGYTVASGLCLAATVHQDGHWLGVVLLHSGNWTTQAETLFKAGFAALRHKRA